ncbi:hypothetical protein ZWY2020_007429 [Hordeum vulgare]|nr:hypothetical protein ZWY2020_007429 [Hordeum vulgare]
MATERSDPERWAAGLTRAAHALRLVAPPMLWLVVEPAAEALPTARLLRSAGAERHHQRNLALEHVEEHRLAGVVLFAGPSDVYDLRFFDQLRQISYASESSPVSVKFEDALVDG